MEYCCWARKRLEAADLDCSIQGYADGVFWERNSFSDQKEKGRHAARVDSQNDFGLFK
jgi:site-specific DNA-methyltransferase (adenine-specific)